ncbi:zinc-binding dehydrogenase, partial [Streptomyces variabilis]
HLPGWAPLPSCRGPDRHSRPGGLPGRLDHPEDLVHRGPRVVRLELLVSGASGGVGSAVLQIARDRGITVVGTAGAASLEYLRGLGAHATTYAEGWPERLRAFTSVDAALDLAGAGVVRELVELTGDPAMVVSIADRTAPELGVRFSNVVGSVPDALKETVRLLEQGTLHIPVEKVHSLTEAAAAHADSRAGHTRGRRVIVV